MQKLEQLIDKNFAETAHGKVANYIPILGIVDPQQLGIAIYDVDEDEIGTAGMAGTRFAIEYCEGHNFNINDQEIRT